MPSRALKLTWFFFNFLLLSAGVIVISFSIIWRSRDDLAKLIISDVDLNAGLVLAVMMLFTWVLSIGGILQPYHRINGLVLTNWGLILDAIGVLFLGTFIWFKTLQPTNNFLRLWGQLAPVGRENIQDNLHCCGYRNSTELAVNSGFCADVAFASTQTGCSTFILPHADYTLNNIFSSVYGLMAVVVGFFLASVCMVYRRQQAERFRRIDEKSGKGFV